MSTKLNVLFIDNFDSFTFNLVDELRKREAEVEIWRNDITAADAFAHAMRMDAPRLIVLSPGPSTPAWPSRLSLRLSSRIDTFLFWR